MCDIEAAKNDQRGTRPGGGWRDVTEDEKSRMTNFNDVMTVAQLIDITAFLQSRHERRYEPMHVP